MTSRPPETVYVITTLGPTDEPGFVVPAQLLGAHANVAGQRIPIWYYDESCKEHP